jgi:diguanylate cyclase (GGDEF)-like protein
MVVSEIMSSVPTPASGAGRPGATRLSSPRPRRAGPTSLSDLAEHSGKLVVGIGLLLIVLVAVADYVTAIELRFYIFYWPSIVMISWYAGRRWGFLAAALSAAGSALANGAEWLAVTKFVLCWNIGVNVASFALLAYMTSKLRVLVDWERDVARTDFVTGLPNTRAFYEALGVELSRSRRTRTSLTLAYLDIDDFKQLNDRFGHDAGDRALREIAQTIRGDLRDPDFVARLGGDEFAILLPGTDEDEAVLIIQRLQRTTISRAVDAGWEISFSIGLVSCAGAGAIAEELVGQADSLMYEAKSAGKSTIRHRLLTSPRS